MKKILIVLLSASLLFANSAFAARFGGGRSYGMQRSFAPKQSYGRQNNYTPPSQAPQATGQRTGMSPVAAGAIGAAAGAAGGYMLGRSMSNNSQQNASGVQTAQTAGVPTKESQIPWGAIVLLLGILALGLMFFRKKISPGFNSSNAMNNSMQPNNFVNPNTSKPSVGQRFSSIMGNTPQQNTSSTMDKMPDGIETIYFLRQAKGMFLHIQSMNNSDNIEEIRKYMVNELFESVKNDVASNINIADFPTLNCQLIECMPLSAKNTDTLDTTSGTSEPTPMKPWDMQEPLVASVKFSGTVSEDPKAQPQPFGEIWNFIKSGDTNGKWLVAGIQQDTPIQA